MSRHLHKNEDNRGKTWKGNKAPTENKCPKLRFPHKSSYSRVIVIPSQIESVLLTQNEIILSCKRKQDTLSIVIPEKTTRVS